jgi:cell division protein FtsQ
MMKRGNPQRIFVGRFSNNRTRIIRTAKNAPRRHQRVRIRKRLVVARRKKVVGVVWAVVRLVLVVGGATLLVTDVYHYMHSSPRFAITHIDVRGNAHVTAREIIARSGIAENGNIFKADLEGSAEAVRQIPWVGEATVSRSFPGQVRIEVSERKPIALVPSSELFLMDESGKIIAPYVAAEKIDVPFITVSRLGSIRPGDVIEPPGLDDAVEVIRLMESMGVSDEIRISEINIDDPKNIIMIAGESGASIYLGVGDLKDKLWRLTKVVEAVKKSKRLKMAELERVDLRFGAIVPAKAGGGPGGGI